MKKAPDDQVGGFGKFGCECRSEGNKKEKAFEQQPKATSPAGLVSTIYRWILLNMGKIFATAKERRSPLWLSS